MLMKTIRLFAVLFCMLASVCSAVAADFTYEANTKIGAQYEAIPVAVDNAAILSAVGASSISDVTLYAIKTDGTRTSDYRGGDIIADGWRTADGTFTTWGNNSAFYVQPDVAAGIFVVGSYPGAVKNVTRLTADFVYVNNETLAETTVTIAINYTLPDVAKTVDLPIYITPAVAYERGNQVTFDFADAKATLGVTEDWEVSAYILQPDGTLGATDTDGWRNAEGYTASWASSASMVCCKIDLAAAKFFDIMAIDDTYAEGSTYTARWILFGGEKSIIYNINITFGVDPASIDPNTFEKVKTIQIDHIEEANKGYDEEGAAPTFSVAEVCEALGIADFSNIETYIVNVTDGTLVKNTTDGWRDANGDAASWGAATNGFCLKLNDPASGAFDYSGAHDANFNDGDTYVAKWAITANSKAVILQVNIAFGKYVSMAVDAAAKYGTFCAPFDVTVPAGVTASTATVSGDMVELAQINTGVIPANTPVVLYAEAGLAATNILGARVAGTPEAGALVGVYADTQATAGTYVLQNQGGKVGFYKVEGVQPTVKANRAYLVAPQSEARVFLLGEETAISALQALTSGKAEIYDLNGRRLNTLQKGINIVAGKKILVK